jgi:glycerophosphoryl diester phosphodiesterase
MTKNPGAAAYAPTWSQDELQLRLQGAQHFLTLGQFGPIAKASQTYTVQFQACWPTLPTSVSENMTLAFAHADDAYYEHRSGLGNGYHAILRADGRLQLFRHQAGTPDGIQLGGSIQTPAPTAGNWMAFQLKVTPTTLIWSRTDVPTASITVSDSTIRGGYLHVGRSSVDGTLAFRSLSLS